MSDLGTRVLGQLPFKAGAHAGDEIGKSSTRRTLFQGARASAAAAATRMGAGGYFRAGAAHSHHRFDLPLPHHSRHRAFSPTQPEPEDSSGDAEPGDDAL